MAAIQTVAVWYLPNEISIHAKVINNVFWFIFCVRAAKSAIRKAIYSGFN